MDKSHTSIRALLASLGLTAGVAATACQGTDAATPQEDSAAPEPNFGNDACGPGVDASWCPPPDEGPGDGSVVDASPLVDSHPPYGNDVCAPGVDASWCPPPDGAPDGDTDATVADGGDADANVADGSDTDAGVGDLDAGEGG
jgi:hypothetical protein